MRKMLAGAVALAALLLGGWIPSPSQAASAPADSVVTFDPNNPPPRYSPAEEAKRTLKGVKGLPKGKVVNKKGYNPNAQLLTGPYYFYAGAAQYLTSTQSANSYASNLHIQLTYLDTVQDSHTLGENTVQSHNQQNMVESGWTHDPIVCGVGNSPCLFFGSWKNGTFLGYNTGFVDYAPTTTNAGATLPTGVQRRFQWVFSSGVWWAAYNLEWIGYYPHSIWTNAPNSVTFDKGGVFQTFYEIATKSTGDMTPCSDLATGVQGNDPTGPWATSGTNSLGGTLPGAVANNFSGYSYGSGVYTHNTVSAQTTRAGGPGYNAAGTGVGSIGSC